LSGRLKLLVTLMFVTIISAIVVGFSTESEARDIRFAGANTQATAVNSHVKISLDVGVKGFVNSFDWVPVSVTLENSGLPAAGSIVVKPAISNYSGNIYRQDVELGAGETKKLLFIIRLDEFEERPVEASFISNKVTLAKSAAKYNDLEPYAQLVIVMVDKDANRQFFKDITGDREDINVVYVNPQDIPSRDNALAPASIMVIGSTSTDRLTNEQKSTLLRWVASGGHLIICGGSGWEKPVSGIPEELLPVKPTGIKTVNRLDELDTIAGTPVKLRSLPIALSSDVNGKIIVGDSDVPLIVSKDFGLGKTTWTALDVTAEPFVSWRSNPAFWYRLSQGNPPEGNTKKDGDPRVPAPGAFVDEAYRDMSGMLNAVSSISKLELPKLLWLIPYLLIYMLIIGPINYLLLRRIDRRELAWITIPAVILVFGLASLAYGYSKKGNEILVNYVNVIEHFPNANIAKISNAFGIFSPSKDTYEVLLPQHSSTVELSTPDYFMPGGSTNNKGLVIEDGLKPKLKDLGIGMWSMRAFLTQRYDEISPDLSGTVTFEKDKAIIKVSNKSKDSFSDAVVIARRNFWRVGDIAAQKDREVKLDSKGALTSKLKNNPEILFGDDLGNSIYRSGSKLPADPDAATLVETINAVFGFFGENLPDSPVLVAWLDKPVDTVQLVGEKHEVTGKTVVIVPLELKYGNIMAVPVGMLDFTILESGDEAYPHEGFGSLMSVENGSTILEFGMPTIDRAYSVDTLTLYVKAISSETMKTTKSYTVSIYDYEEENWHKLGAVQSSKEIEGAARFVSEDGKIKARISTSDWIEVTVFDFEVRGTWQ